MDESSVLELTSKQRNLIVRRVYSHTGIDLQGKRDSFFQTRIAKHIRNRKCESLDDYLKLMDLDEDLFDEFIDSVTTHETYFFRTHVVWEFLKKHLMKGGGGGSVSGWSCASSSGEEAFSLAILFREFAHPNWTITGTDISQGVLKRAREGVFSDKSLDRCRKYYPLWINKYFSKTEVGYQVAPELQRQVEFQLGNLMRPHRHREAFSIVLLRNVLIYFSKEEVEKIISYVHPWVREGGLLVLGESESLTHLTDRYENVSPFIYQKIHE